MALPKVEYPVHVAQIAGLGGVKVRPFSGYEERALLTTKESEEASEIVAAIDEVLRRCTFEEYGTHNLTSFQAEQLFVAIRSYSVGPDVDVYVNNQYCDKNSDKGCPKSIHLNIPLNDIKVETPEGEPFDNNQHPSLLTTTIIVDGNLGFVATQPPMDRVTRFTNMNYDYAVALSIASIEKVFDAETVYTEFDDTEIAEWYDALPFQPRETLATFVLSAPTLKYRHEWTCDKCNKTHEIVLQGLDSFFG